MVQTVRDLFAHDENMRAGFRLLFSLSRISLLGKRQCKLTLDQHLLRCKRAAVTTAGNGLWIFVKERGSGRILHQGLLSL